MLFIVLLATDFYLVMKRCVTVNKEVLMNAAYFDLKIYFYEIFSFI